MEDSKRTGLELETSDSKKRSKSTEAEDVPDVADVNNKKRASSGKRQNSIEATAGSSAAAAQ